MDLEQLQKEAEKDLKIDKDNLDIESLKTPELYGKYLQIFTRWNLLSKHKVDYHNAMCDYAEKMCKMLNNRGFQIKNAIDWKRFLEGSI